MKDNRQTLSDLFNEYEKEQGTRYTGERIIERIIPSGPVRNWACCSDCGKDHDYCRCPDY